jgi:TonB family protein
MPTFPGGNSELAMYIQKNLNVPGGIEQKGKAYVKFAIDTNGKVISQEIIKTSKLEWLDKEALRLVSSMPKWNPGINAGKKVSVYINLPISYGGYLGVVSSNDAAATGSNKTSSNDQSKSLTLEEKKALEFFDLGMKASKQERYESALVKFDSCLKYNPVHRGALLNKAAMHYKLDQKKYMCSTFDKLLSLNSNDKEVEELKTKYCK